MNSISNHTFLATVSGGSGMLRAATSGWRYMMLSIMESRNAECSPVSGFGIESDKLENPIQEGRPT